MSILFSAGNSGSGNGLRVSPIPPSSIGVGASTVYGAVELDSPASVDQVTWGDLAAFSGRGPSAPGTIGVHLLAVGDHVAGLMPVNFQGPPWLAGGGTSASCPIAAGNLALVYDAYRQAHGAWPTHETARALLMAGARDIASDPLAMAAGMVDAERSTALAAGGVLITPDQWVVGNYRGEIHPAGASIGFAGLVYTAELSLLNTGSEPETVSLSGDRLVKTSQLELEWTPASIDAEDPYDVSRPDALREITDLILADTDLLVVRAIQPFATVDPDGDSVLDSHWRLLAYDWTDVNGDETLWHDDGDGAVDAGELEPGEYVRLAFSRNEGTAHEIRFQRPLERIHDGLFLGLQHETRGLGVPSTSFRIRLELYRRLPWSWLDVTPEEVVAPARESATVVTRARPPAGTAPGLYSGRLAARSGDHESSIPVVVNLAVDLAQGSQVLGGPQAHDPTSLCSDGVVRGLFEWSDRNEYGGDRRLFFVDVPDQLAGAWLEVRTI